MTASTVRVPLARLAVRDLELVAHGGILEAVSASERLRKRSRLDPRTVGALVDLTRNGDALAAMISLHSLSAVPGLVVDHVLADALSDATLAEHGAWALAERLPVGAAIPGLVRLVVQGGFPAMPAQLALERWGGGAGSWIRAEIRRALAEPVTRDAWSRLSETLSLVNRASVRRVAPPRPAAPGRGLRVAQILLRGRVDAALTGAGASDGGGVVTLLVQLAAELGRRPDIERSLIVGRPRDNAPAAELVGPHAAIVRLPFGPDEDVPVEAMWEHRARVERAVEELLQAHPVDVAHLRYADAATFAAARALRRMGVRIAFTLAPDPHALIADRERAGLLTREELALRESTEHNLFRLRLVDRLVSTADHLVTLPRPGGHEELEHLLGRPLPRGRTSTVSEGIDVRPLDRALDAARSRRESIPIASDLRRSLDPGRWDHPCIVSVGRLHPVKGFPRLVEAWAGDPVLVERFNLVIAGGSLEHPDPIERSVLEEIRAVLEAFPVARDRLVLLGARPHGDVADLLAIARHGVAGEGTSEGVYACASEKEEFGVAILEAMACGLPVVAPARGGPGTYVEHDLTGALVEPTSVEALRAGLHHASLLASTAGRAEYAERLVRERFSIRPMADALTDAYRVMPATAA